MKTYNKIKSYQLCASLHIGHIEIKCSLQPLVWRMPFLSHRHKKKIGKRIVDGGTFQLFFAPFHIWTFRTIYFGLGLDLHLSRNPFFGRVSATWPQDIVFIDMQRKVNKTK